MLLTLEVDIGKEEMCVQDKTVQTISPSKCHSEAQPEVLGTVACHNTAQGGGRVRAVTVSLSWHYRSLPRVPGGGEALVVVVLEGVKGAMYLMLVLRANTKGCSPLLWVQLLANNNKAGPLWGHQVGEGDNEREVRGESVSQLEREAQFTCPCPQGTFSLHCQSWEYRFSWVLLIWSTNIYWLFTMCQCY